MLPRETALADYVTQLYPHPGVESLLLRLQNDQDLDVLLLLAACWLGCSGRAAAVADWRAICDWQAPWHRQVIGPLRAARTAVRGLGGEAQLYSQLKECEQAAEWSQLKRLEAECLRLIPSGDAEPDCLQHLISCCLGQGVTVNDTLRAILQELADLATEVG
ncbi:TIGR02444 family protein [uncultured Halopseudomonas sp.]|uniref:TIGR02444 family protein n=1 Tax=uncultured Halopseudomonas sp. TaxID=2901193 RepID=UPI0030ED20C2|tara:strand:- start:5742 stop:6227 length:486 start_codon:yes stop_codon:yes gene_type:complete